MARSVSAARGLELVVALDQALDLGELTRVTVPAQP